MLHFNGNHYFIRPINFGKGNMEFDVFSHDGSFIGSTINMINNPFSTTEEQEEFESFIFHEAQKTEAKIKFMKQYQVPIEEVNSLGLTAVEIFDCMEANWNVSCEVLDELIGDLI